MANGHRGAGSKTASLKSCVCPLSIDLSYDKVTHHNGWHGDLRAYPPTYDD